jgi:polyhydroxyalkanoate synthase
MFPEVGARIAATLARLERARHVSVGCSHKQAVFHCGKTTLYRYLPLTAVTGPPLLICFALVNRPYVLDLQPDRSLIRRLLEGGRDVYLIDWGDADESDRRTGFADYVETHLGGCVRHLRGARGAPIDLMGVCQGGVLSLCYAALEPRSIGRLITVTTPVDFHTPENLLGRWVRGVDTRLLEACGNLPGEVLNALFLALMPFRLTQEKYVRLLTGAPDQAAVEDFVRMERWIFDSPPQAAAALAQFVRLFYQENAFVRGTLRLNGRALALRDVRQPLLNLYALGDHIVPSAACAALERHVGSRDYSAVALQTGHIGMYVSRAAREQIPRRILAWLSERDARGGDAVSRKRPPALRPARRARA